jgi:hypothetical protein
MIDFFVFPMIDGLNFALNHKEDNVELLFFDSVIRSIPNDETLLQIINSTPLPSPRPSGKGQLTQAQSKGVHLLLMTMKR